MTVLKFEAPSSFNTERYVISTIDASKKGDVRGEDSTPDIIKLTTKTQTVALSVMAGDFYVPLDQPLVNIVVTALEPESNSSYLANRILRLPEMAKPMDSLPLWRVMVKPSIQAAVWLGE